MILEHNGKAPRIDASARIAPNAVICGDVTVGAGVSVGFGAVITAESGPVTLGKHVIVMENAVLRGTRRHPLQIGDHVLIGPHASLTGCAIADEVFLATGCAVFNGARVERAAEVRINAIVHLSSVLPAGATLPIGWIAVGDPAEMLPPVRHEEIWARQAPLNFPRTVFGVDRPPAGESNMKAITERYSTSLMGHLNDKILSAPDEH